MKEIKVPDGSQESKEGIPHSGSNKPLVASQNLDVLSRQILSLLQENGRRSFSSIARELEVSEGSVRSRIGYLEEHQHLRFIAVVDPVHVGSFCWAMLGINVVSGTRPSDLALELSKHHSAVWVGVMSGGYDLMVEVWAETPVKLQAFLEDCCYAKKNVASVETMVGLRVYKWGAPEI